MPPNSPNTEVTLDTENREAAALSVRQQWNTLRHLLHLPSIIQLQNNAQQELVGRRIVATIEQARGPVVDNGGLLTQILTDFRNERDAINPSTLAGTNLRSMEERGMAIAEAWLNVIYRHIERRDVEQMIEALPAQIKTTDGRRNRWYAECTIGANTGYITVDLNHPIWRLGTVEQIRRRIENATPAEAGIIFEPPLVPPPIITTPIADEVFHSMRNVVSPTLPLATYTNQIPGGQRIIFDLPGLIRERPVFSLDNEAAFSTRLAALPNYSRYIRVADDNNGSPLRINPLYIPTLVRDLFANLSRSPNQPFAAVTSTLEGAINTRQPIDQLMQGSADSRELMLALSALQADPSAARGLINSQTAGLDAARNRFTREKNIRTALTQLSQLKIPVRNDAAIRRELTTTLAAMPTIAAQILAKQQSIEMLQKEMDNYSQCVGLLGEIHALCDGVSVFHPEIGPGGRLENIYNFGPGIRMQPTAVNRFSPSLIVNEVERAFANIADRDGVKSDTLHSVEHYDDQLRQNQEARTAAGTERTGDSNACWQVIRARLEDQGMRGPQLESTLQYMRSQVQKSPESQRDAVELTNTLYHYEGDEDDHAQEHWEEGKQHTFSFRNSIRNPYETYQTGLHGLFTADGIGYSLDELRQSRSRRIPLPRLLDAYFSMKYLSEEVPSGDPRRLPESQAITGVLRAMHQALLDREAESLSSATGMNEAEQRQVGITPEMSLTEKLQQAQSFLTTGKQAYIARNKYRIDKISERAYEPIRTALENRTAFFDALFKGKRWFTNGVLPLGVPSRLVRLTATNVIKPAVVGGSWKNPAAWISNTVQGGSKFIWRLLNTAV